MKLKLLLLLLFLLPLRIDAQTNYTANLTAQSTDCSVANSCLSESTGSPSNGEPSAASFAISGTFSATLQFEAAGGDGVWWPLKVYPSDGPTGVTSATATGLWQAADIRGYTNIRVRCSTFGSGSVVVAIIIE